MLTEIVQLKHIYDQKFTSAFNFLYKFFDEVDDHLRDMGSTVAWTQIKSVYADQRYFLETSAYHPHLSMSLEMPESKTFWFEVCARPEGGFEVEVEIFGKGWAVCGTLNSFQFAYAALMAF